MLKKFPEGAHVWVDLGVEIIPGCGPITVIVEAVVIRHGRDAGGIYTEVLYDDGTIEPVHRARISKRES